MKTVDDKRPIKALLQHDGQGWFVGGKAGTTKIRPYEESGQLAPVVWFEIWRGDVLDSRVNAVNVAIIRYGDQE